MRISERLRGAVSGGVLMLAICGLGAIGPAVAFDGRAAPALLAPGNELQATTGAPDGTDRSKTLTALEYAADQGHLAAQWKMGRMYAAGDGVARDDKRAFVYFSQIANTHPEEPPGTAEARIVA